MPNYNGGKYLNASINSVINQSHTNWELIIVDDCSTDNSSSIIKQFSNIDSRIKLYVLEQNSGTPATPRNKGFNKTRGDYIAFLDSDDVWHPRKLETQLKFMMKYKSDFSFTNVIPFYNESDINSYLLDNPTLNVDFRKKRINYDYLLRKNFVKSCSTALLKREVIGGTRFNNDPSFRAVEDYMFWLDILKTNCKVADWLDLNTTFYRESDSSISSSKMFMVKQNYKVYNFLFQDQKRKKLMVWYKMLSYGYYSIKHIIKHKLIRK